MKFPRSLPLSLIALASVACSSVTETAPTGTTTTTSTGAATGTGAGGATSASTSSSGAGGGESFTTIQSGVGPINVLSGAENTQCITVSLKNPVGGFVRRFRAELGIGSHHMIVYRSNATTEAPTPVDCPSFSGLLGGEHPIFIAQQAKAELDFPTDDSGTPVGLEIDANQMVRIELHYINPTAAPIDVTGKVFVDTVPLSATVVKSDLAFWGTKQFNIPANGTFDTGVKFQPAWANTRTFALTTHQHHLGTRMRVWYATDATDVADKPVADGQNWSDPPLELFTPSLVFDNGNGKLASKGFAYECEWKNTTPNDVAFGEGFNDEMCFLWHYYYPSQGFQICFDGLCKKITK